MSQYKFDYLDQLEAEAIHIMREVAGQFQKPALLFSGGKDSITLVRLAEKALSMVQTLDPAGVAARDLRECLLLFEVGGRRVTSMSSKEPRA